MDCVRIGFAGFGVVVQIKHFPAIEALQHTGRARLVAVANPADPDGTHAPAGVTPYADVESMLASDHVDLVVNATPIPAHFEVTLAALRAHKHVYSQKPLCATVEEATRLIEEARERRLVLACAPEHPVTPTITTMRGLLAAGAIGRVTFAKAQASHGGPEKQPFLRDPGWYYQSGSSPLLDLGVHGLSKLTALLGPVREVACFSTRSIRDRRIESGLRCGEPIDVEIDDNQQLLLDFGDGTMASMDATYCVEAARAPELEIYGTDGTISLVRDDREDVVHLYQSATRTWRTIEVTKPAGITDLGIVHVVECLAAGVSPALSATHARHLVEIMAGAASSAASRRTVRMRTVL